MGFDYIINECNLRYCYNNNQIMRKLKKLFLISLASLIAIIFISILIVLVILEPGINDKLQIMPLIIRQQLTLHNGQYVPINQISHYAPLAAIASQDERFYTNPGVDLKGTIRAIIYTLLSQQRQGASTITEQLAKNVYFNDQDNLQTDVLTKIYALYITQKYSKSQIMEMYLNEIYFGHLAYGINSASRTYFHISPQYLNIEQSAYLLGLINAPSYFAQHPTDALAEASIVLGEMRSENFITTSQQKKYKTNLPTLLVY